MVDISEISLTSEIAREILTYEFISVLYMDGSYIIDPVIDEMYSISPEESIKILDILSEEGYFRKEVVRGAYCRECFSTDLIREYVCPKCHSSRIIKDRILRHKCGYKGVKRAFINSYALKCPKCHAKLYREGEDYFDEGVKYKCIACGAIFDEPMALYRCSRCGAKYFGKPPEMIIINYEKIMI